MGPVPAPRPPGDGHLARAAALVEAAYPDWAVTVEGGRLVARHRREVFDLGREQWGTISTTLWAATPQQMRDRLDVQQVLREGEASP